MTSIEHALFRDESAHWVSSIDWPGDTLVMKAHPSQRPHLVMQARFERVRVVSVDDSYAGEERWLPWDIIGFDAEPLSDGVWRFCLHTDCVEYDFESHWPQITKPPEGVDSGE